MNAVDIGAAGVVFVPHFGAPVLPDLMPWMTAGELEVELLYTHLRTLSDYAEAMGVDLYVEPINRYETHLLNRLEQAAQIARRLDHPRVKIVADLFHMALEEADIPAAIRDHADCIGHVHLADNNRRLPGQGMTDFAAAAAALNRDRLQRLGGIRVRQPGHQRSRRRITPICRRASLLRRVGGLLSASVGRV